MAGKLLDTNAYIALQKTDPRLLSLLEESETVVSCTVVIGELAYGAFNSQRVAENLEAVRKFAQRTPILEVSFDTALVYGQLKSDLKTKGTPLPENDIWIAAFAVQYNLTLVTEDSHFEKITLLKRESWKR